MSVGCTSLVVLKGHRRRRMAIKFLSRRILEIGYLLLPITLNIHRSSLRMAVLMILADWYLEGVEANLLKKRVHLGCQAETSRFIPSTVGNNIYPPDQMQYWAPWYSFYTCVAALVSSSLRGKLTSAKSEKKHMSEVPRLGPFYSG